MASWYKFISSNFSGYLAVAQIVGIIAAVLTIYCYGWNECKEDGIVKNVEVMEVRNEIANNRPDDMQLIDSVRKHDKSWK